jgi:uncharacterized membrane protein YphA (DoxX/SURF4 family)
LQPTTDTATIEQMATPARPHNVRTALSEGSCDPLSVTAHPSTKLYLGRHVLGLAAIAFGIVSFVWHDFGSPWQQIRVLGNISYRGTLVYLVAAVELSAGIAIQWRRTARTGAFALAAIYLIFALLWVPRIVAEPLVYDRWGNFFEQFSIVSGALIIWATSGRAGQQVPKAARIGCFCFGLCVVSFTLEQLFYLSGTAEFVPKWIPPGQMFWAITTTIAFALAAVALLSGRFALLAARLTTAMILAFGLLIWLPRPLADPRHLINWAGNAQNLAIAAAAWIVADFLDQSRRLAH